MSNLNWTQDVFSKGELSPLMYSRTTVDAYHNGMKTAKNVLTYPQGAAGKRFGTNFVANLTSDIAALGLPVITDYKNFYFKTFQYSNECTYLLVFIPSYCMIYLEGFLVGLVATPYQLGELTLLDSTTLSTRFRVASGIFPPYDLVRSPNLANVITAAASDVLTITTATTAGIINPVRFTTTGTLPTSTPPIRAKITYFAYFNTANTCHLYANAEDAANQVNAFTITNNGTGVNTMFIQNVWNFGTNFLVNFPVFDFGDVNYSAITFTPVLTSGYGVTINASAAVFNSAYVGGAIAGNGGIARIVSITSTTAVVVNIITPFANTNAIPGNLTLLAEPAWSNERGWPSKCSSFQSRSVFANSDSLPNGLWLSVINDYNDFDGLEALDDNGISWYPSSDSVSYIRFIVPYRSLTIHTNGGIYSTPLTFETAVTPTNFSMTLQDSTPASSIQPRGIDNQIIIISGNDVHSMLWDGFNNSYSSSIASVANEHLIRDPHDEAEYTDLDRAGSRYMFIVNDDGSLVIFQTLIAEQVQGFTPARLEQPVGNAYFRWVASSTEGRAWFLTEREITSSLTKTYFIEELDFNAQMDLTGYYSGTPTSSIAVSNIYDDQEIYIQGDGYGFTDEVTAGTINITAHGRPQEVSEAQYGFPINVEIVPMPVAPPGGVGFKGTNLVFAQHIRILSVMVSDTIGGEVNGKPILLKTLSETEIGEPPQPMTGVYQMGIMKGWDVFSQDAVTITHSEPFGFRLIGLFYKIEE